MADRIPLSVEESMMAGDNPMAPELMWASGSGAFMTINGDTVCKQVTPSGAAKLRAEAEWIRWARERGGGGIQRHLPAIVRAPEPSRPALVLELVPGVNARHAVLTGADGQVDELAADAVRFAMTGLARLGSQPAWDTGGWCARHLAISLRRAVTIHPVLKTALRARWITIGDKEFRNPLEGGGRRVYELLRSCRPARTQVMHGDLHLGNMVVDPDTKSFFLVDPRGEWSSERTFDPAYDVAKLLHEAHYVLFRHREVLEPLEVSGNRARFASRRSTTDDGGLGRLASRSINLARVAGAGLDDEQLARRATLLTGVLLLSVLRLPFSARPGWTALLAHGLSWLAAGIRAVEGSYGWRRCERLWRELMPLGAAA